MFPWVGTSEGTSGGGESTPTGNQQKSPSVLCKHKTGNAAVDQTAPDDQRPYQVGNSIRG